MAQRAALLFAATSIVAAISVAGMLVSGWHAGVLDNSVEWIFWAGAILGAVGIGLLGIASMFTVETRSLAFLRVGLSLFLVAPVLCVVAVFADYWI